MNDDDFEDAAAELEDLIRLWNAELDRGRRLEPQRSQSTSTPDPA